MASLELLLESDGFYHVVERILNEIRDLESIGSLEIASKTFRRFLIRTKYHSRRLDAIKARDPFAEHFIYETEVADEATEESERDPDEDVALKAKRKCFLLEKEMEQRWRKGGAVKYFSRDRAIEAFCLTPKHILCTCLGHTNAFPSGSPDDFSTKPVSLSSSLSCLASSSTSSSTSFVVGADAKGNLVIYDGNDMSELAVVRGEEKVDDVAVEGDLVFTTSQKKCVDVWRIRRDERGQAKVSHISELACQKASGLSPVDFLPPFLVAGTGTAIHVWKKDSSDSFDFHSYLNARTGAAVRLTKMLRYKKDHLVSVDYSDQVHVWNVREKRLAHSLGQLQDANVAENAFVLIVAGCDSAKFYSLKDDQGDLLPAIREVRFEDVIDCGKVSMMSYRLVGVHASLTEVFFCFNNDIVVLDVTEERGAEAKEIEEKKEEEKKKSKGVKSFLKRQFTFSEGKKIQSFQPSKNREREVTVHVQSNTDPVADYRMA